MKFKDVEQMRTSTLKRFVRLPRFDEHLALHRLDCLSSNRRLEAYEFVSQVSGGDATGGSPAGAGAERGRSVRMGYTPGPRFSEILRRSRMPNLKGD